MRLRPLPSTVAALVAAVLVLAGCAPGASHSHTSTPTAFAMRPSMPTLTPTVPPAPPSVGTAATAAGASVAVYDAPDGHLVSTLANPTPSGAPLTFLVATPGTDWLRVNLAQRPNGSTGWIKASTVTLHSLVYRLEVSTAANTMALYKNSTLVATYTVATGTGGTPTPHGSFYLTELLAPTNPGYGPYAFGLSAFSEVLNSFGGGPGEIGLHGTNDASSIGHAASHGCVRMQNADITTLAKLLPLGTPITIS